MRPEGKTPDWFQPIFRTEGNTIICEGDAWTSDGEIVGFQLAASFSQDIHQQFHDKENLRKSCWEAVWLIAQDRSPFEFGGQHSFGRPMG